VELWADYCAYDHVALAQLWGPMIHLPKGIPMYTNDIQTYARLAGVSHKDLPKATGDEHHALADAPNVWDRYTHIRDAQRARTRGAKSQRSSTSIGLAARSPTSTPSTAMPGPR